MTLFWHPSGPIIRYNFGMLEIEDLNPELKTRWRMSRVELMRLGWKCFVAAMRSRA